VTNISIFAFRFEKSTAFENNNKMKKDIHPKNYRLVAFKDMSNEFTFLTKSTAPSKETIKMEDGIEYPLIKLEISSTSHPFYTGKMKLVDTAGRVDKFMNRYKTHLDKKNK
jgi:large subunit ribosomal protein L31